MVPYGEGKKGVLIVGEAPGANEDKQGRPFVGKAGQYLRETLKTFGVSLDRDCVTTNALICRPPDNKIDDPKKIGYCRPNLIKTIGNVDPKVIITLGQPALRAVIKQFWKDDLGKMERWIGWQIPVDNFTTRTNNFANLVWLNHERCNSWSINRHFSSWSRDSFFHFA